MQVISETIVSVELCRISQAANHSFLQLPPRLPLRSCGVVPLLLRCSCIRSLRPRGVVSNGCQQQSDYEEDSCYICIREEPKHCRDQQSDECTGSKAPVGWLARLRRIPALLTVLCRIRIES